MKKKKRVSKSGRHKRPRQASALQRGDAKALKPWMALLFLTVVVLLIYSNIYRCPFVFDDRSTIIEKGKIRDLSRFDSLRNWSQSRAVVFFTFALNYRIHGFDVTGYHLVNVAVHIANTIIVYLLALVLFKRLTSFSPDIVTAASLFAALVFAAHPLQTQAVTFTSQRFASMAAMFYMAAVLFYILGRNRLVDKPLHPAVYFFLVLFCGMLALACKSNTASLPGAILLVELLSFRQSRIRWKKTAVLFTALFIVWVFLVLFSRGFFTRDTSGRTFIENTAAMSTQTKVVGRWDYFCTQFNVISIYIRMLILPYGQNADHLYPFKKGFFDDATPAAFLFLTTLAVLGTRQYRRRPIITFAVWWFFITLSVESSILPINDAMFEHRLYLPMAGFALAVPYLLYSSLSRKKFWALTVLTAIVFSLGTATYLRNRVWRDEVILWRDSLKKNPLNPRVCNNLGMALSKRRQYTEAYKLCAKAFRLKPDYAEAYNNAAWALVMQNKLDEAQQLCGKALDMEPDLAKGHDVMGVILIKQGKKDEAIRSFRKALELDERIIQTHINLGNALLTVGETEKAMEHYREALERRPDDATAHNNLGRTLYLMKRYQESIVHCNRAVQIRPSYPAARTNLGYVLLALGKHGEAAAQFEAALRLKPGDKAAAKGLNKARNHKQ